MRPKGTPEQLAGRRTRARELLASGQTVTTVAKAVGVSRQAIYTWQVQAVRPGNKRHGPPLGRPCKLKPAQQRRLEQRLLKGAFAFGYPTDHWTLERIAQLIFQTFGVRYHPSGVWRLMQRLDWSCQKMTRVGLERDEAAIADWQARVWPRVKKGP